MPGPHPFFSVVVPTWNRGALVSETIRSLLDQDFPASDYEVIVVDDGSTDDTVERLREFSDRIRLVRQANAGAAAARNLGNSRALGEYIVSFDSDDLLLPWALTVYKQVIDSCSSPPVILAQPEWFRGTWKAKPKPARLKTIRCIKCRDYFGKNVPTYISNSLMVIRREEILRVGGYGLDSEGLDDDVLMFKLGTVGPLVIIRDPVTVGHRLHEQNGRKDLGWVSRGLTAHIRNERQGLYPGGRKRMLERRGLMGSDLVATLRNEYLRARHIPIGVRLSRAAGLLMQARGLPLAWGARKAMNFFKGNRSNTFEIPVPGN